MKKSVEFTKASAMTIDSKKRNSIMSLPEEVVFEFEHGIPAFEEMKKFVFLIDQKIKPFLYMQSLDSNELCFVCVDPFLVKKDYSITIPEAATLNLGITSVEDALVLSFVTVKPDFEDTTANLMGPIVINVKNRKGKQIVLDEVNTSLVRYKIWDGINAHTENKQRGGVA